jgi:hypothetical protein
MLSERNGFEITNKNMDSNEKFLGKRRQLDHSLKDDELLTGTDKTLRAAVTDKGFCI